MPYFGLGCSIEDEWHVCAHACDCSRVLAACAAQGPCPCHRRKYPGAACLHTLVALRDSAFKLFIMYYIVIEYNLLVNHLSLSLELKLPGVKDFIFNARQGPEHCNTQ